MKAWTANATTSFTLYGSAATGNSPTAAAVADFNGDGNPDIAVTNSGDNTVTILLGNDSGAFTQAPGSPIAVGGQPQYVASGDFNGDGIVDLAVANFQSTSNSVTILLGNGDGTFYQAVGSPVAVGSNPWFIAVADMNGDGKADLAMSNGGSGNVTVLLGNGDGTFTAGLGSPLGVGSSARSIAVADFNGDGRPDVAVANYNDNTISILVQNSGGTGFTAKPNITLPAGTNPWTVVASDFNADGKADLAVTGFSSNKVYVFLGNGDGTFTQAPNSPVSAGSGATGLLVEDFNHDGRPDIAVADQNGNVTVLQGSVSVAVTLAICSESFAIRPGGKLHRHCQPSALHGLTLPDSGRRGSGGCGEHRSGRNRRFFHDVPRVRNPLAAHQPVQLESFLSARLRQNDEQYESLNQ